MCKVEFTAGQHVSPIPRAVQRLGYRPPGFYYFKSGEDVLQDGRPISRSVTNAVCSLGHNARGAHQHHKRQSRSGTETAPTFNQEPRLPWPRSSHTTENPSCVCFLIRKWSSAMRTARGESPSSEISSPHSKSFIARSRKPNIKAGTSNSSRR